MKAIETKYKGRFFRSRLEARWACYFDSLKIIYMYEPEGFTLSNGSNYLPDFFLPDHNLYVEIKPVDIWDTRWPLFAAEVEYPGFLVLVGDPGCMKGYVINKNSTCLKRCDDGIIVPKGWKYFPIWFGSADCFDVEFKTAIEKSLSERFEQ